MPPSFMRDWDQASRYFERIVSLTPNKALAHFNLSFAYAVQKRYEDAAREQGVAIELDPGGPRTNEWRARLASSRKPLRELQQLTPATSETRADRCNEV